MKQIVKPRIRGFIATNAHPEGCRRNVQVQVERTQALGVTPSGFRTLVVGASTGYGLSSRIAAAFGFHSPTLGIFYERPPEGRRTATAGYYNAVAFHQMAQEAGIPAWSLNGDAFSDALKEEALEQIRRTLGQVDVLVYSLAAPRRLHPKTGVVHQSVLKPTGAPFTSKTIDLNSGQVTEITLEPATGREVADTIEVMGGEDWAMWIDALLRAELLAPGFRTVAFSYIGPELTHPVYRDGSIGEAKRHLEQTAQHLNQRLQETLDGHAWISVNKAVVTQAAAAIPVVPLYLSILYPVMQAHGVHETPIDQMNRLFREHLAPDRTPRLDEAGRIRLDDRELDPTIQAEVLRRWKAITTENLAELADFAGFRREFHRLFGFEVEGVDYDQPVETDLALP